MNPRFSRRMRAIPERTTVNVEWLMRLRWAQIVGQAATITGATLLLGVVLPVLPLMLVVGVGLASNLALELYVFGSLRRDRVAIRPVAEWRLAGIMILDVALLTVLLALTGGPLNPFGFLYLVQIALATVILEAAWTWALVALSFLGFGLLLLLDHRPLTVSPHTRIQLLTNNPQKIAALRQTGIEVVDRLPLHGLVNAHNERYMRTKQQAGHLVGDD